MPAVGHRAFVEAVLSAIDASGSSGVLLSPVGQHPKRFTVSAAAEGALTLWVYGWTLTPGGRPSLPNEYRIQMTSVSSPLALNPSGQTVLLGYEPDLGLFAGFDLERHRTFTFGSPSVQIDIRTVRAALDEGLAFARKSNDEIAIGFRPDQFVNYALSAGELHRFGRQEKTRALLQKAARLSPIAHVELAQVAEPRQRVIQRVGRFLRDANFRQQVLFAYDRRCAVTRGQLRLVDAAHILPVGAPGSLDTVCNGIALAPTYHRAFDTGLIFLTEDLSMAFNPLREAELRALNLAGGIEAFRAPLGPVLLPPDKRQWPGPAFIKKANRFRMIPT